MGPWAKCPGAVRSSPAGVCKPLAAPRIFLCVPTSFLGAAFVVLGVAILVVLVVVATTRRWL